MLILYVVWGSTYLGIAIAVETIPPFLMAAIRFVLAGLILLTWSVARGGRSFHAPSRREWRDSAIVGALLLGGGMGMVAWGEQTVPSGIAALLVAMVPVWIAIFGRIFLGERLPGLAVAGIAIGFVGVAVLVGPTALGSTGVAGPGRTRGHHHLARSAGRSARCSPPIERACRASRSSRPGPRC